MALKEDNSIQGLVGIKKDEDAQAVYIHWAVVAPWNNKQKCENIIYTGVGGHLFAIAIDNHIHLDTMVLYMVLLQMNTY